MAAIALRGVRKGRIALGDSVAVLGMGIVGQLALSLARLSGAMPLIALDLDKERLERAMGRGAELTINPGEEEEVVELVRARCREDGANAVIEATGKPAVYPLAVQLACTGGRVVALGSPRGTVEMDFMRDVHLREVDIIGAFQPLTPEQDHVYYRWTKDRDRRLLLELMAQGRLSVKDLITHRFSPEQCQEAYEILAYRPGEALGVIFEWKREV
jgi:threonine dehydrogenase-like Zn-dependent dehydrogenase